MLNRDAVLQVLRQKGPCQPLHIRKALGEGDSFTIGAVLSELKGAGKVKVSNTKRGGPFYYIPEHADKLTKLIQYLGEKDRRTAELLKQKQILKDDEQEPLARVSLRQVKDFAVPLEVKTKDGTVLFWKWYQLQTKEAEPLIKQALGITPKQTKPAEQPAPIQEEQSKEASPTEPSQDARQSPEQAPQKSTRQAPKPATQEQSEAVKHEHTKAAEPEMQEESGSEEPSGTPEAVPAKTLLKQQDDTGDDFLKQVLEYFAEKRIQVIAKEVQRKNSDIEFEISVPTAVGRVTYFCKAKNKKKSNDGDLSNAYVQGQMKKLPVIYLTTGDVTKKAKEKLNHEFKGLLLVQL